MTETAILPAPSERPGHDRHDRTVHTHPSGLRGTASRVIVLVLAGCALAAAAVEMVITARAHHERLEEWQSDGFDASVWVFGPRDYQPGAASMAAVSLLCAAIGGQLLRRRPWRSLGALTLVTGAFVTVSFLLAYPYAESMGFPTFASLIDSGLPLMYDRTPRLIISVWAGTVALWLVIAPSRQPTPRVPDGDYARPSPPAPTPETTLVAATRRAVSSAVVTALIACTGLAVFFSLGGLQLFFTETTLSGFHGIAPEALNSTSLVLMPLAIWAGWLTGAPRAGRHRRTWALLIIVGVVLSTVDGLWTDASGSLAIPSLAALAVVLAVHREEIADRVVALLGR